MNKNDVVIGMKVIPMKKTSGQALSTSGQYKYMKDHNMKFMYVCHQHAGDRQHNTGKYILSPIKGNIYLGGDYFMADDFEPFFKDNVLNVEYNFGDEDDMICKLTTRLDEFVERPTGAFHTYMMSGNRPNSLTIRYPGATRGHLDFNENNIITRIKLHKNTAIGGSMGVYKEGVEDALYDFIGAKIYIPWSSNHLGFDKNNIISSIESHHDAVEPNKLIDEGIEYIKKHICPKLVMTGRDK